jgi:uncharacterized membrane protein (DUF106 family)
MTKRVFKPLRLLLVLAIPCFFPLTYYVGYFTTNLSDGQYPPTDGFYNILTIFFNGICVYIAITGSFIAILLLVLGILKFITFVFPIISDIDKPEK